MYQQASCPASRTGHISVALAGSPAYIPSNPDTELPREARRELASPARTAWTALLFISSFYSFLYTAAEPSRTERPFRKLAPHDHDGPTNTPPHASSPVSTSRSKPPICQLPIHPSIHLALPPPLFLPSRDFLISERSDDSYPSQRIKIQDLFYVLLLDLLLILSKNCPGFSLLLLCVFWI